MSKSVVFSQCGRIACAGQTNPAVILCLDSADLLADNDCDRTTIEGVLTNVYKDNNCGTTVSWRYVVSYDENLLADPTVALISTDVNGIFCKSCLTQWVEDEVNCTLVPQEPMLVTDTESVDLTINPDIPQTLSADVNISADAGNSVELRADGLYVLENTALTVGDTASVDLTLAVDNLIADVSISADADNGLSIRADGLYAVAGGGVAVTVDDTDSVGLTLALGVVTADVIISPDAENTLVSQANGLYVSSGTPVGTVIQQFAALVPEYLLLAGGTIGSAASAATLRANDDTLNLFTHLWGNLANAQAPVSGGRGASAAADFAANKILTVPDMRQKFPIGQAASGTGSVLGGTGGVIDHTHDVQSHYHKTSGGSALQVDLSHDHGLGATSLNGDHQHNVTGTVGQDIAWYESGGGGNRLAPALSAGTDFGGGTAIAITNGAHTHGASVPALPSTIKNVLGNIGNATTGLDGDLDQPTSINNPPYIAINFFIKY